MIKNLAVTYDTVHREIACFPDRHCDVFGFSKHLSISCSGQRMIRFFKYIHWRRLLKIPERHSMVPCPYKPSPSDLAESSSAWSSASDRGRKQCFKDGKYEFFIHMISSTNLYVRDNGQTYFEHNVYVNGTYSPK